MEHSTHFLTHITATVYGTSWSPHTPKDAAPKPPPPPVHPEYGISAYQPTISIKAFLSIRYFLITLLGMYITLGLYFLAFLVGLGILLRVAKWTWFTAYAIRFLMFEMHWRRLASYWWRRWIDVFGRARHRATQTDTELGRVGAPSANRR
jgi:hypothetical protein